MNDAYFLFLIFFGVSGSRYEGAITIVPIGSL